MHFGLILTINLWIGQKTPPVTSVALITRAIAKIIPSLLGFIGAMLVALILANVVPAVSIWLPSVLI